MSMASAVQRELRRNFCYPSEAILLIITILYAIISMDSLTDEVVSHLERDGVVLLTESRKVIHHFVLQHICCIEILLHTL